MCSNKPCITSVCGLQLKICVVIIGALELLVTLIASVLNIVKYSVSYDDSEAYERECQNKDVCIGEL